MVTMPKGDAWEPNSLCQLAVVTLVWFHVVSLDVAEPVEDAK